MAIIRKIMELFISLASVNNKPAKPITVIANNPFPKIFYLLLTGLVFYSFSAQAQEPNAQRPKIGLVLSGGGAKGLAHIGVLKVLEEAGIRPDYITGTSMGSIIGGLYACGYSAAELDSIAREADWSVLLSDQVPLTDVAPVEKYDYNRFQLEFDVTDKGLMMPSGMVRGQRISELLSQLTWRVADINDFDDLPIPFRCVAADLITGQPHVFDSGDLMIAMRSSMAIPSVFTPVLVDSMYLVDGGVLDNFPVKLCRDMGADIIIGVNVGFKDYPTMEDLNSISKVLVTASTIGSNPALVEAIAETDLLISPDLYPYSSASFKDGIKIVTRGEEAALGQLDNIKALADSLKQWGPPEPVRVPQDPQKVLVKEIQINNLENVSRHFFMGHLGIEKGDSVDAKGLNSALRRLVGTRFFEKVTYEITPEADGSILTLFPVEVYPTKAKFSLRYDNELNAGIIVNLTSRNFLFNNTRWSLTGDISTNPRVQANLYSYLGENQNVAYYVDGNFEKTPLPIYLSAGSKYGSFSYLHTRVETGFIFALARKYKISTYLGWNRITLRSGSGFGELFNEGVDAFGNDFLKTSILVERNTLNRRYFPTKGSHTVFMGSFNLGAQSIYKGNAESEDLVKQYIDVPHSNYSQVSASYSRYFPVSKDFNIYSKIAGGVYSDNIPFLNLFFVGGTDYNARLYDTPFVGLRYREKMIQDFGLAQVNFRYLINNTFYLNGIVNGLYAAGFRSQFEDFPFVVGKEELIVGYGLALAMNSIIGPVSVGVGSNFNDNQLRWYINVGFPF
ncbi:patatin [Marinilabiliaceae bacterium JC017]|nr:patatin [Marinilabiliaceae bacterium JC017]